WPVAGSAASAVCTKTLKERSCQIHAARLTETLNQAARIRKTREVGERRSSLLASHQGYRDQQARQDNEYGNRAVSNLRERRKAVLVVSRIDDSRACAPRAPMHSGGRCSLGATPRRST